MKSMEVCPVCSNPVSPGDTFCGMCGARLESGEPSDASPGDKAAPEATAGSAAARACPVCGQQNDPGATSCSSCGAALASPVRPSTAAAASAAPAAGQPAAAPRSPAAQFFQSWKFTAVMALILIAVVVVLNVTRDEAPAPPSQAQMANPHGEVLEEIHRLEHEIEENPANTAAMLELANRLQDMRAFPRAIAAYERYLATDSTNADARVDYGVCFVELAFRDSLRHSEHLERARMEFERALHIQPAHQAAQFNLGLVFLNRNEMRRAREWFTKCYETDSTSEIGKRAEEFIKQHSFTNPS